MPRKMPEKTPQKDYFSDRARQYAAYRPRYPGALFAWLAAQVPERQSAWDCACGNGQASADLAGHFARVIATDLSGEQLRQAAPHPRIDYRVATAEASGLEPASVDLVTVAQALHWFDCGRFYAEVRRVLRPAGLLAAWSYGICHIDSAPGDALLTDYYRNVVGPYWPAERRHVESGYRSLPFPGPELPVPPFEMAFDWNLEELMGYVASWSATMLYVKAQGVDPVPALRAAMAPLWGDPDARRAIRWPLTVRAARAAA